MSLTANGPLQVENDFIYVQLQQFHTTAELENNFTSIIVCCWTDALLSAIQHRLIVYFGEEDICTT
jgi:hypothetical protein